MYRLFFKRLLDVILSAMALIILSPIYMIVAIYVAVTMGLPVLFSQERTGLKGKTFKMYKFRSMTNKKDNYGNLLPESERLTKAGILLRSSSLDELPEIWSIFIGKMSIIGPRPLPTYYEPYYYNEEWMRHDVRGGLLPPDSLSGDTTPTWETQLEYDRYYAENLSFALDCRVLWVTFKILFKRTKENYGNCERPHLSAYRKDLVKAGEDLRNRSINEIKK